MADSVRAAVRDRLRPRSILAWCGFVAFLFWASDDATTLVGTSLVSAVVVGLSDVLAEVYGLRPEIESLGTGLIFLLSATGLSVFGDGAWWVSGSLVAITGWWVLDTIQTLRHEGLTVDEDDESRDGRDVYHDYVTRKVDETLREQPLTRRELSDALDPDDAALDRAVAELDDRGLLVREGSELRTRSPPEPGALARARGLAATAAARLAQPLTVEFEGESSADDTGGADRHGPVAARAGPGSRSDADREREREPAGRR